VDPSYGARAVLDACGARGRTLTHILLTHAHGDHVAGVPALRERPGCSVLCHPFEARGIPGAIPLDGEGAVPGLPGLEVLFTPGHTPGSVCYRTEGHLFTGDTLFVDWVGRADFAGGDPRALFSSLAKLRALPTGLMIHPGHDYGSVPERTLGEEARLNKFFACTDFEEFLRFLPELAE
jgi:glyoxylase-like metal-dependent hydrolase (beta-lactamase superfamily II)